ncbi:hypothetical protein FCOIX_9078 [Fusarium coicis]|nr:hypothetical protein FCOIX_9078 [Fusarium coicis]
MGREWFKDDPVLLTEKGWPRSSECYLEAPEYLSNVITGPVLLPPPKSWDVSSFELAALEKFYRETLLVDDSSLDAVLKELDKKSDFHHSKQLYGVLNETWEKVSTDDLPRLREYLKANQCIILSEDDTERYSIGDCIWAPKLDCPKNASKSFPELQTLFVDVLGMKKTGIGLLYHKIVKFICRDIYLEKKSAEAATAVHLPLVLARFLMGDPNHKSGSRMLVDAMLPSSIRTILRTNNRNLPSIKKILDEEGIVDVDKLANSPYIPENDEGELSELLDMGKGAQRSCNHGSRPTQDSKANEVHGNEDDLTREFGSLSLKGNADTTSTVWGSDSTK